MGIPGTLGRRVRKEVELAGDCESSLKAPIIWRKTMRFIDPHIHMSARTTDDYERMAAAGIIAIVEPAFWLGQPRTQVGSYIDYMSSLVGWERFRAAQFGIRHYCTIGLNSKEANNEETVQEVLDRGFWAAFTIYPHTKMGNERMVEIARKYGSDHIFIDSSADWGVSDPLAVPKTARLMLDRGIAARDVEAICYGNALKAFGQSGEMKEEHWLDPATVDQRMLFEGNSVLRGQAPRVGEPPAVPRQ